LDNDRYSLFFLDDGNHKIDLLITGKITLCHFLYVNSSFTSWRDRERIKIRVYGSRFDIYLNDSFFGFIGHEDLEKNNRVKGAFWKFYNRC
jgi:hypothetical protein